MITIRVNGLPAPQGSKRHVGNGRMVESSQAVGPWREAIRAETQRTLIAGAVIPTSGLINRDVPAAVEVMFYLPRPASAPKRQVLPVKRPDLDKLGRAVLDGLVAGGALADDSQVTCLNLAKSYATPADPPGAVITISEDTI